MAIKVSTSRYCIAFAWSLHQYILGATGCSICSSFGTNNSCATGVGQSCWHGLVMNIHRCQSSYKSAIWRDQSLERVPQLYSKLRCTAVLQEASLLKCQIERLRAASVADCSVYKLLPPAIEQMAEDIHPSAHPLQRCTSDPQAQYSRLDDKRPGQRIRGQGTNQEWNCGQTDLHAQHILNHSKHLKTQNMKLELQNVCLLWDLQQQAAESRKSNLRVAKLEFEASQLSTRQTEEGSSTVNQIQRSRSQPPPQCQDFHLTKSPLPISIERMHCKQQRAQLDQMKAETEFLSSQLKLEKAHRVSLTGLVAERDTELEKLRASNQQLLQRVGTSVVCPAELADQGHIDHSYSSTKSDSHCSLDGQYTSAQTEWSPAAATNGDQMLNEDQEIGCQKNLSGYRDLAEDQSARQEDISHDGSLGTPHSKPSSEIASTDSLAARLDLAESAHDEEHWDKSYEPDFTGVGMLKVRQKQLASLTSAHGSISIAVGRRESAPAEDRLPILSRGDSPRDSAEGSLSCNSFKVEIGHMVVHVQSSWWT